MELILEQVKMLLKMGAVDLIFEIKNRSAEITRNLVTLSLASKILIQIASLSFIGLVCLFSLKLSAYSMTANFYYALLGALLILFIPSTIVLIFMTRRKYYQKLYGIKTRQKKEYQREKEVTALFVDLLSQYMNKKEVNTTTDKDIKIEKIEKSLAAMADALSAIIQTQESKTPSEKNYTH